MSIATDIEVTWNGTVDSTNKIGLSKPLNQLPVTVFDDAEFCLGYQNKALKLTKESESYPHSTDAGADNVPFYLLNNVGYSKNSANEPDGVYYRTILIAAPNGFTWGWDSNLRSNNSQIRIVTKLNLQKNKLYFTTTETQKNALTTSDVYLVNESIENTTATGNFVIGADTYHIRCADIYLTENGYYIKFQTYIDNMYDNFNPTYGEGIAANFNYNAGSSKMYSVSPVMFANVGWVIAISGSGNPNTYYIHTWNDTELDIAPDSDNADIKFFAGYRLVSPYYWRVGLNYSVEYALWIAASYGLLFEWNGTPYKPVIEYGALKGYTDDMTVKSDIDNWTDVTGHNISPTPPVPPSPTGDDIDKQHFGGGTALGGAENLWLLTTAQMTSLHNAISSCDVPNFEPLNSVISVMGLAIPPTYPLGTDIATLITINIRKADGTLWSTHTEGHICDKQTASFGFTNNIKIKRRYNNFLDYPPYSSHEIFLPLCGWLPLPAYAVGRNLTVYYVHDINTCSVRGLVFCEGSLIGEKYGTMGANIPFSSSGHSLYVGGLITGGVQTLADFATALSTKGPMALMSVINGVAEGANTLVASNQNRTSVIGQNQDRTSFADGQYIRIKSTYPDVKIEENFGHTFGFVCNKKGQLKDFKGFTTCENPHVYGFSCTSEEKDEIERLLKAGIIINIPEE
jgi:hypothetical protein